MVAKCFRHTSTRDASAGQIGFRAVTKQGFGNCSTRLAVKNWLHFANRKSRLFGERLMSKGVEIGGS